MKTLKTRYFILKVDEHSDNNYVDVAVISIDSRKKNPYKDKLAKPLFEAKILEASSAYYKGTAQILNCTNVVLKVGDPGFEDYLGDPSFDDCLLIAINFRYDEDDEDFGGIESTQYWSLDPIEVI